MALPPTPTVIPLPEAAGRYLQLRRHKALIRRLSPATVGNDTAALHRFLELLPHTPGSTPPSR